MLLKVKYSIKPLRLLSQNREMSLFTAQSLKFLKDLKKNNDREWFQPRKALYEELVKEPMFRLIEQVNQELVKIEPAFVTEPKRAMLRVYRDTRFAEDKTPYKTNASALFWRKQTDRFGGAVLYLSVSPVEVIVAGGSYRPTGPELLLLRQHLAEHHARLTKILKVKVIREYFGALTGDQLQRAPKGFDPDHKAIELLKQKQWALRAVFAPKLAISEEFVPEVLKHIRLLIPFVTFLNEPLMKKAARAKDPLLTDRA